MLTCGIALSASGGPSRRPVVPPGGARAQADLWVASWCLAAVKSQAERSCWAGCGASSISSPGSGRRPQGPLRRIIASVLPWRWPSSSAAFLEKKKISCTPALSKRGVEVEVKALSWPFRFSALLHAQEVGRIISRI